MGRTAAQFCSRESAYRIHADTTVVEPYLTWQQNANFGLMANMRKHRGPDWQRLDLETIQDSPIFPGEGDGNAGSGQGPRVSAQQQARAKANACDINSSTPTGAHLDTPNHRQPARNPRKRHPHPKKHHLNAHDDEMGALPRSAFVPPHLRGRTTTPTESASAGASGEAIEGAPPPSAPTSHEQTAQEPTAPEVTADATESAQDTALNGDVAWDEPKPEAQPVPRRENPRWPRTRGPPKKTVWPKQRDMKPVPTEGSSDEGGVTFKSDSDGDPFYDVKKLMDWNGDWLPPPEQWSARKGHTNRHFGQDIERWMNGQPEECLQEMDKTAPNFLEGKEVVPKYWIVSNIEQGSLNQFWKTMSSREPRALSDVSIRFPFWERYEEGQGADAFIEALTVPDAKVDPGDLSNHLQGADLMASAEARIESIMLQRMNAHKRSLARQRRPIKETVPAEPQLPDRRLIPESNVYFRPVQPGDVEGIAAVYNYYVENTIYANEFDARTYQNIAGRIDVVIKAGLPFLVAVSRDCTKKNAQGLPIHQIVGFASLDDYCDQESMYRYTFELELYVHPGLLRQKIGSCLLDRLLEMANTSYNARGGYEWINEGNYLKTGPSRVIRTIMLTVMRENGNTDESDYDFLKKFKFIRTGHIPSIGYKMGKVVDVYLYRHTTSEPINPHVRPGQQINYH